MVVVRVFRNLFRYPDPVNENAARLIAAGVVALAVAYLLSGSWVVIGFLAYGFVARVLTGPTLSPLAQIVNTLLVPLLSVPAKLVPGPPKRFAQGIGATLAVGAVIARMAGLEPASVCEACNNLSVAGRDEHLSTDASIGQQSAFPGL